MPIILDGTTGITTPGITNTGTFVFQGPVQVPAGSAATASITTAAGANTGIFFPSSSSVAITTAGTQRVVVSASGDVGIGTSSPQTRLEANQTGVGSVVIPIVAANQDTSSTGTGAGIGFVVDGVNDVIGAQVAGIRTGSAYHQSALTMYTRDSAGGGLLERVRVDSAGNLGLGVVPSAWTNTVKALQVNTTSALWANSSTMFLTNNTFTDGTDKYITTAAATRYYQSAGSHIWNIAPSGTAGNAITFTQAMTLDTSGNLGLGVVPSAWGSPFKVIEGGDSDNQSWIGFQSNANAVKVGVNCYYDGANYRYKYTGAAGFIGVQDNVFSFAQAASGTAGNTISFTQGMTLDASGNLSLGFTGGATRLGVRGPMYVPAAGFKELGSFFGTDSQATGNGGGITLGGVYTGTAVTAFAQVAGLKENSTDNNYAGYLAFYSRPNGDTLIERARIMSDGNLAIGRTSATELGSGYRTVDIDGTSGAGFRLRANGTSIVNIYAASSAVYMAAPANVPIVFETNNTERARIASNGDFGIGTSAPAFKLDVSAAGEVISGTATTGSNMRGIRIYNTTTATTNNAIGLWLATGPHQAGIASFRADAGTGWDTVLAFYTHQTTTTNLNDCYERMRITGDGSVLIGQSSPNSTAAGIGLHNASGNFWIYAVGSSTTSDKAFSAYSTGAGAYRFFVDYAGNVNATNTTITGISDIRLKENIRDLDAGLDAVMALKPRKFDWKEGKGKNKKNDRGFIAQEFEQVFPDLVTKWEDNYSEGEEPYKAVCADLIPVLVKAIQELKAELDALKGSN